MRTEMHRTRSRGSRLAVLAFAIALAAIWFGGCGTKTGTGFEGSSYQVTTSSSSGGSATDDGSSSPNGPLGDGGFELLTIDGDVPDRAPPPPSCKLPGLWCYQTKCTTTLSGTVFDPAGTVPLSNAIVYVPADPTVPLEKITTGTKTCSACTTHIDNYLALAVSDVNGHFSMTGVPATTAVPVVVQIGKWRHEVTLKSVTACTDNKLPDGTIRLPRSKAEGDIPQMAVLTGGFDDLGCFLHGMGLDPSEYGAPGAGGRLDVYQGVGGPGLSNGGTAGACSTNGCPLWASKSALETYDIVLLACEGGTHPETKGGANNTASPGAPNTSTQALHDWLSEGGKVFATHFQYFWFTNGPTDFQTVGNWLGSSLGIGMGNYTIDTSFARGQTFDNWLSSPGVTSAYGTGGATGSSIALTGVASSLGTISPNATRWIYDPNPLLPPDGAATETKYMSFLTPIGGSQMAVDGGETTVYCGKAVFSDLHTSGQPSGAVPSACAAKLTAQQKALEYLFFDLAACVAPENVPMPAPPPNPPPPPPPPM